MNPELIERLAIPLLAGQVLHGGGVTAGRGKVIDWRTVKCGDEIAASADAYDTAVAFVALVGPEVARSAMGRAWKVGGSVTVAS
jgi:hypothetical protein